MGILDSIFGKKSDPMQDANQYLNQIPGVGHQGYDPYINAGQDAGNRTKSHYESMLEDPTGFINKLMEGYKPSEGYNYQKELLNRELGNTAAAGGLARIISTRGKMEYGIQKLLSGDMQQFLQNVLGRYDTGLKGEEGIAGRGFNASQNLTDLLGSNLNQQGSLAFQNARQNNEDRNSRWSTFGKALGAGAGFAVGGPAGATAGYKLGGGSGNLFGGD